MYESDPSNQYKEMQVKTAKQGKLIVMLYEGAIKFVKGALENVDDKRKYDVVNTNIIRAQDIVAELMCSLNFDAGDFATKLYSIYSYINRRLVEANIKKQKEPLEEVLRYLEELKDTWIQISNQEAPADLLDNEGSGVNISL